MSYLDETFGLSGRVALVTGAGAGVGAGIASVLALAGATVLVNDVDAALADSVARRIGGTAVPFDVTDADAVLALADHEVGIVVNNAGIPAGGSSMSSLLGDLSDEALRQQLELNQVAPLRIVQAVLPGMLAAGWGRVVQISSGAASQGLRIGAGAYGSAKAGAESMMRHLAIEYARTGVTANSLALGMMDNVAGSDVVDKLVRATPLGRPGTGADVGAAVLWLCSTHGGWVTGQTIHLNGGTIQGR